MKQTTHNTVLDLDKPCTKSSKKYKRNKLKDYQWTVVRTEPHHFFGWGMASHYVKLADAENMLRKSNGRFFGSTVFELIPYKEYLDRKSRGLYNERNG